MAIEIALPDEKLNSPELATELLEFWENDINVTHQR